MAGRPTWLGRVGVYLAEMFPPLVQVPSTLLLALAIALGLQALAGGAPLRVGWRELGAAATVLLLTLLMRIADEVKDAETDRRLAAAGDARFASRPLVQGRVTEGDLRRLAAGAVVAGVTLNLLQGSALVMAGFAVALLGVWLSSRWFFWPRIRKDLLLAFVTHNPLTLLFGGYVAAVAAASHPLPGLPSVALLLGGTWAPVAAWEIARKVRAPVEETAYETYSRRLGPRVAGALPAVVTGVGSACLLAVARSARLGVAYAGLLVAAWGGVAIASAGFAWRPTPAGARRLRPAVEVFTGIAVGGLLAALIHARGLAWGGGAP